MSSQSCIFVNIAWWQRGEWCKPTKRTWPSLIQVGVIDVIRVGGMVPFSSTEQNLQVLQSYVCMYEEVFKSKQYRYKIFTLLHPWNKVLVLDACISVLGINRLLTRCFAMSAVLYLCRLEKGHWFTASEFEVHSFTYGNAIQQKLQIKCLYRLRKTRLHSKFSVLFPLAVNVMNCLHSAYCSIQSQISIVPVWPPSRW